MAATCLPRPDPSAPISSVLNAAHTPHSLLHSEAKSNEKANVNSNARERNPNPIMCRCTDPDDAGAAQIWRPPERRTLRIRAFHLRLVASGSARALLPETLTLVYLPSALARAPLEVNGSKIRQGTPVLVFLHRFRSVEARPGEVVYASTDRVCAVEGQRFEAYAGEQLAAAGALGRGKAGWEVELHAGEVGARTLGVKVVGERGDVVEKEVELRRKTRKDARKEAGFCVKLEGIPEEECACCVCEDGWELVEEEEEKAGSEVEVEGVRWAVDVGLWVMCLGVGLLVTKASSSYVLGGSRGRTRRFLF